MFIPTKRILIADITPEILESTKLLLEDFGYEVCTENNPEQIINLVKNLSPELLLLQTELQFHDGKEICNAISRDESAKKTPVILMSTETLAYPAIHYGAVGYIGIPFHSAEFIETIESMFDSKQKAPRN
ncbi:two-component system response regulator [Pedobacter jeongneungensis]|uniref:response regulator n=1 Tax=Pedobacter jeongneungensis TaxID=947309 RepID=UPI000469863C|nr:response regulator [Pedobacter jeongneungensis]